MKLFNSFSWLIILACSVAQADEQTVTAPASNTGASLNVSARLNFEINMGKYLFFRVGTGAYPTASSTVDTVALTMGYQIPATPTSPSSTADHVGVNWDGTTPTLTSTNVVLPVEVKSNAGQINLKATINAELANGSKIIPFSNLIIDSSDSNLPAPPIPNTGSGSSVNVVGTAHSNLVTDRSANWTFSYATSNPLVAGVYEGEILFTASSP